MWLGGFNDNILETQFTCTWVDCPESYLPEDVAVDFDRTAPVLGPFGQYPNAVVRHGKCSLDSLYFDENDVRTLGQCVLRSFNEGNVKAQIMWNFRNQQQPRWSYVLAYDAGWIKQSHYDAYAE